MEAIEYERMFRAEDRHWWYLGMQEITYAILKRFIPPDKDLKILDAGCGTGQWLSSCQAKSGAAMGFDISPRALKYCRRRHLSDLAQASVVEIPFKSNHFDLLTSFDVLYERSVKNDLGAMAEFFRVLRPGGLILLRLPAYNWLRGQHDIAIHTARRYNAAQVVRLLQDVGFRTRHTSYANTILFPLAAAKRLLERIIPPDPNSSDLSMDASRFNRLLKIILSSEALPAAHAGLPYGLSILALGQKPKNS